MYKAGNQWFYASLFMISLGMGMSLDVENDVSANASVQTSIQKNSEQVPAETDFSSIKFGQGNKIFDEESTANKVTDKASDSKGSTNQDVDSSEVAAVMPSNSSKSVDKDLNSNEVTDKTSSSEQIANQDMSLNEVNDEALNSNAVHVNSEKPQKSLGDVNTLKSIQNAKDKINKLPNLTNEEKQRFINNIDYDIDMVMGDVTSVAISEETVDTIEGILNQDLDTATFADAEKLLNAKADAADQLNDYGESAKHRFSEMSGLTAGQIAKAFLDIDNTLAKELEKINDSEPTTAVYKALKNGKVAIDAIKVEKQGQISGVSQENNNQSGQAIDDIIQNAKDNKLPNENDNEDLLNVKGEVSDLLTNYSNSKKYKFAMMPGLTAGQIAKAFLDIDSTLAKELEKINDSEPTTAVYKALQDGKVAIDAIQVKKQGLILEDGQDDTHQANQFINDNVQDNKDEITKLPNVTDDVEQKYLRRINTNDDKSYVDILKSKGVTDSSSMIKDLQAFVSNTNSQNINTMNSVLPNTDIDKKSNNMVIVLAIAVISAILLVLLKISRKKDA